ncbi:hypothetical protein IL306_014593, partial [Fusarium sp. DS 682]
MEEPLPANAIELYSPDVFGLEAAAADCRFEMIKIVREASQNWCHQQTPQKERLPTYKEWESTKGDLKSTKDEVEKRNAEIIEIKKKLEAALILWSNDAKIRGISVVYTTGKELAHGQREGNPQNAIKIDYDEVITELEVHVVKVEEDKRSVQAIAIATSKCNILVAGTKAGGKNYSFSMAEHDGFEDLGVVWGKDKPSAATSTIQAPPAKNFLGMGSVLQDKTRKAMTETKSAEHFYLGDCISTGSTASPTSSFSSVDNIAGSSKITKVSFSASAGRLCGLKIEYSDKKELRHGAYSEDREVWNCEVKTPIVAAKLTVGKTISYPEPFMDTV